MLPCAQGALENLVLFEPGLPTPACKLVERYIRRVGAVTFALAEGHRHRGGIAFRKVHIRPSLLRLRRQLRLLADHLEEGLKGQPRLIQPARHEEGAGTILTVCDHHIHSDCRIQERLAVLPAHNHQHLAELAEAVLIHHAEHDGDQRLLPHLQRDQLRGQRPLMVSAVLLDERDRPCRLLLIEEKTLFLQPVDDVLIPALDPLPDSDRPVLDLLIVCQDVVLRCHPDPAPGLRPSPCPPAACRSAV